MTSEAPFFKVRVLPLVFNITLSRRAGWFITVPDVALPSTCLSLPVVRLDRCLLESWILLIQSSYGVVVVEVDVELVELDVLEVELLVLLVLDDVLDVLVVIVVVLVLELVELVLVVVEYSDWSLTLEPSPCQLSNV